MNKLLLAALLFPAFLVHGDEPMVSEAEVRAYIAEMNQRYLAEITARDDVIRRLEPLARKARNFQLNCNES